MYEPSTCRICGIEIPGRHPSVPRLTVCDGCARVSPELNRFASARRAPEPPRGPTPPPGKAPLRTIDDWEALPSEAERMARMNEVDQLLLEGQK